MQEAQARGSVRWPGRMLELVEEAQFILLTGWTHDEYMATPAEVVDAVWQVHLAQKDVEAWQLKLARKRKQ